MSFLTGSVGGAQATRAARIRRILETIVGAQRPNLPTLPARPPGVPTPRWFQLLGASTSRGDAERAAYGMIESLLNRSFKTLPRHLHPTTWLLWPDGTFARHETSALLEHLRSQPGRSAGMVPEAARVYSGAELRSAVARGIVDGVEAALGVPGGLWVSVMLRGRNEAAFPVFVLTAPDDAGVFRAGSLLLPGLDHAHRKSVGHRGDDEAFLRIGDRIARHFLLGHDGHLRSLRNDFLDRVYVDGQLEPAERIAQLAGEGSARIDAAELVFLGAERVDLDHLARGRAGAKELLTRGAKEAFGRRLDRLELRVVSTRYAELAPETLERGETEYEVLTVLVGVPENEALTFRVGAFFP